MDEDHHTLWNALCEACALLDSTMQHVPNEREIWDFLHRVRTNKTTSRIQREVLKTNATSDDSLVLKNEEPMHAVSSPRETDERPGGHL